MYLFQSTRFSSRYYDLSAIDPNKGSLPDIPTFRCSYSDLRVVNRLHQSQVIENRKDDERRNQCSYRQMTRNLRAEPIYPEYIQFGGRPEGYEDDETEDGPVDYPMDEGDDDDGDSSKDDARDKDEDEEDEEDEEEEEHLVG
ncbi:hypothetical protein Tco_1370765 [Tanacetum coccineum]